MTWQLLCQSLLSKRTKKKGEKFLYKLARNDLRSKASNNKKWEIKFSYKNQIIISWQNYNWTVNDDYDENDDEDKYKKKEGNAYFLAVCQKMISISFSMSSRTKEKDAGMIRKIMAKYTGSNESSNVRDDAKNYKNTWGFSNIYTHTQRNEECTHENLTRQTRETLTMRFILKILFEMMMIRWPLVQWIEGTWVVYGSF